MCFSVQVDTNIKDLAKRFSAKINTKAYQKFMAQSENEKKLSDSDFKKIFGVKSRPKDGFFRTPSEDKRIYPNYFTHVMTLEEGERVFSPMRYRVRPHGSKQEVPSKFNIFNARLDSLNIRKTWADLIGRNHGIFAFNYFYEWVEHENKKRLITFHPKDREVMWAPCLWDEWVSKDGKFAFKSFAIITTDPPPEVLEMGHDRCPFTIEEAKIDAWLSGNDEVLKTSEILNYSSRWAS